MRVGLGRLDGDTTLDFVTTHNIVPLGPCSRPVATGLQAFDAVLVDLDGDGLVGVFAEVAPLRR